VFFRAREIDVSESEIRRVIKRDEYYDDNADANDVKEVESVMMQKRAKLFTRNFGNRTDFKNISFEEAEKDLEHADIGEYVIRPSSKGPNHLTVTIKVAPGLIQHIDVVESGKQDPQSIGKTLTIGTQSFEDLDEIVAYYIDPLAQFAKDVVAHRKFKHMHEDELSTPLLFSSFFFRFSILTPFFFSLSFFLSQQSASSRLKSLLSPRRVHITSV